VSEGEAGKGLNSEIGGRKEMKIVKLCREGSCCPVVKVTDTHVEIGEAENTCILTMTQWEILKEKITKKEL